jgi:hypothetical protein
MLWEWWNHTPTLLPPQATQTQNVLTIATAGGSLGVDSVRSKSANGLFDLRRTMFSLAPGGVAVFKVALEFLYENTDGGMIQARFAHGDAGLMCPAMVMAILS